MWLDELSKLKQTAIYSDTLELDFFQLYWDNAQLNATRFSSSSPKGIERAASVAF